MKIRTVHELMQFDTFEERFEYLRLGGSVGKMTFGFDRYLNQALYSSGEWKRVKRDIVIRDNGCDLADPDRVIHGQNIYIHHLNPITQEDILNRSEFLFNPNYLITTTFKTHQAIHYGDTSLLPILPKERTKYDTCPWRC